MSKFLGFPGGWNKKIKKNQKFVPISSNPSPGKEHKNSKI
jgi:hypothetical protein